MQVSTKFLITLMSLTASGVFGQTTVLSTDFESGIPAAYSIVDNDGLTPNSDVAEFTSAWISLTDPEDNSNTVAGSTSYFEPVGTASRWLITPALTLGSYGNFVSWKAKSHDASFPDDYLVLVSNTDTELSSFTDTIGNVMEENADWTFRSVDLSLEGYNDQTIYVAFVNVTEDGFKLYMDSVNVWKEDPVGMNEDDFIQLSAFPNPFVNFIQIESSNEIYLVRLYDGSGRVLLESTEKSLVTESIPSGAYFAEIRTNNGVFVRKLIKH